MLDVVHSLGLAAPSLSILELVGNIQVIAYFLHI